MDKKSSIRKKFFTERKKKYFEVDESFFYPLRKIIKKISPQRKINIALYYPSFFEVNVLKILSILQFRNFNFLLPIVEKTNSMNFYKWKKK